MSTLSTGWPKFDSKFVLHWCFLPHRIRIAALNNKGPYRVSTLWGKPWTIPKASYLLSDAMHVKQENLILYTEWGVNIITTFRLMWVHLDTNPDPDSCFIFDTRHQDLFPIGWCVSNGYELQIPIITEPPPMWVLPVLLPLQEPWSEGYSNPYRGYVAV